MRWFAVPGAASTGLDVVRTQTVFVCPCAQDSVGHDHRCLDRRRRVMRSDVDRPNAGTTWATRRSASPCADTPATQDFEWSQSSADLATWAALLPVVMATSMARHPARIGCRGVESEGVRQCFVGPAHGWAWCRPVSAGVRAGSVMKIYGAEAWHAISDVIRVCPCGLRLPKRIPRLRLISSGWRLSGH